MNSLARDLSLKKRPWGQVRIWPSKVADLWSLGGSYDLSPVGFPGRAKRDASLTSPSEVIGGSNNALTHTGIPGVMSCCTDNNEFAAWPVVREPPWCDERCGQVQAAMDQDAGNAGKTFCFPQENAILKPAVVTPIVGHKTSEAQPECGLLVSGVRFVVRVNRHD